MKTITLQDRHALLLHALLKRLEFTKALEIINAEPSKGGHRPDGTDICIAQYPAIRPEINDALCEACRQLKYQLNS